MSARRGKPIRHPATDQPSDHAAGGPRTIADVLSQLQFLRGHGRTHSHRQLAGLWRRAAGAEIGDRTRVVGLKNGTLHVAVTTAALLGELTAFHQHSLLDALQHDPEGGRIRKLKFQLRGR